MAGLTAWRSFPSGELGTRVAAAFADELKTLGGTLLDSGRYDPAQVDFSDVIKTEMQLKATKVEKGEKPVPPTHRTDAAFIFVAASTAGTARLIMTQLKFYYAGDVPVYSTSDSFEPDPTANSDIDGMFFPDMPWMISNDPVHRANPRQRACGVAGPHRAARPPVRIWVRRLSLGTRPAVQAIRRHRAKFPE